MWGGFHLAANGFALDLATVPLRVVNERKAASRDRGPTYVNVAVRIRRHPSPHKLRRSPAAIHLHLLLQSESVTALPPQT